MIKKMAGMFSKHLPEGLRRQFLRYITAGLTAFSAEFAVLYLLKEYARVWYIYSNTAAYFTGFWTSFLLNKYWTFGVRKNFFRQLVLTLLLFFFNLAASNTLLYILTDLAGIYYLLSKFITMTMVFSWNFVLYRKFIYR